VSTPKSKGKVILFGIAFWYPLAGVTYQFLHYLIGLRKLGYDAYYIEDSGRWIYDPRINDLSPDASYNVSAVAPILDAHGFAGKWAFRGYYPDGECYGMTAEQIEALYREADAFLNVTAAQELREEHLQIPRKIYVESDPFPAQVKAAGGDASTQQMLAHHDVHFSFGENLGSPDCLLPTAGVQWHATRQPVVVDLWADRTSPNGSPYTTITTWHNKDKDLEFEGRTWYWTKDREFKKHLDLPERTGASFELAVGDNEEALRLLAQHGWSRIDSLGVSRDVEAYRDYIRRSRGEWTVAREQYTGPRTGWFSDRSACYLAAGRPVVTEDTGFGKFLPTGEGLFAFADTDEAVEAIKTIEADHARHCRAAEEIAREYFEAEKVVGSLMERAGL
jgi:hypothetical protein